MPDEFPALARLFAHGACRSITEVHLHHTFIPCHDDYRAARARHGGDGRLAAQDLCQGMWRFHVFERDFADIAQHVSIDPEGGIWLNRNWNRSPASATGFNGDQRAGPFMIETIGNFDEGHDRLESLQRHAVLTVIASIQLAFDLPASALGFHNEMTDTKSCPGTGVSKPQVLAEVEMRRRELNTAVAGLADGDLARRFEAFLRTDFGALKEGPLANSPADA